MAKSTYNIDIQVKNINTGVEATVADSSISSGQFVSDQPAGNLKSGGGIFHIQATGNAGVTGQFNVNFPNHGHYIVKFSVTTQGEPCLEIEDHSTPARLISEQHQPPKIVDSTMSAMIEFLILV